MNEQQQRGPEQTRGRARCEQVLAAAATCFSRRGFHGASMAELAKASGMSVGHIYHYFQNKEAIIEAIVERDLEYALASIDRLAGVEDVETAMICALVSSLAEPAQRDRQLLRLEVLAEAARSPQISAKVRASDATARQRFIEVLTQHGVFSRSAPEGDLIGRAEAIIAVFEGITVRALRNPSFNVQATLGAVRIAVRALLQPEPNDALAFEDPSIKTAAEPDAAPKTTTLPIASQPQ